MIIAKTEFKWIYLSDNLNTNDPLITKYTLWHYQKNRRSHEVFYLPSQNNTQKKLLITWADYDSFTAVDLNWARDKNHYYYNGEMTDLVTLYKPRIVWAWMYIIDDNHVYDGVWKKIDYIDRSTFQKLGENTPYAKDKEHIYLFSNILTGVDYTSFKWLNGLYAKDKNNIYIWKDIVIWADNLSFESLRQPVLDDKKENILYDAKDANHYYKNWKVIVL
jgi:hypothetical protein